MSGIITNNHLSKDFITFLFVAILDWHQVRDMPPILTQFIAKELLFSFVYIGTESVSTPNPFSEMSTSSNFCSYILCLFWQKWKVLTVFLGRKMVGSVWGIDIQHGCTLKCRSVLLWPHFLSQAAIVISPVEANTVQAWEARTLLKISSVLLTI